MFKSSKKKSVDMACLFCESLSILLTALATICTLAALVGFYKAHVLAGGLVFGTTLDSFSIIALVLSLFLLKKTCENCGCQCPMPTKKK